MKHVNLGLSEQDGICFARNIKLLMFYKCLMLSGSLTVPILAILLMEKGLSVSEIFYLQALFSLSLISLETPTGYLADMLSRKLAMSIGAVIYAITCYCYSISNGFWDFAICEFCFGVAISLVNGADQAMFYDSMLALNRKDDFGKLWSRLKVFETLYCAAGTTIGGTLACIKLELPYYVASVGFVSAFFISRAFIEPPREQIGSSTGLKHLKNMLSVGKMCLIDNHKLRWLLLMSASLFGFMQAAMWYYQPYWQLSGIDMKYNGFIYALFNVFCATICAFSLSLERRFGLKFISGCLVVSLFLSYLLQANFVFAGSFLFALLHQGVRGFISVVYARHINDEVGSKHRATIASVQSTSVRFVYTIVLLIAGFTSNKLGILGSLNVVAAIIIAVGYLSMKAAPPDLEGS